MVHNQTSPEALTDKSSETKSDNEISSTEPSEPLVPHTEFFFDDTLVAIQVENTLFNVHKYQLAKSEVLLDRFNKIRPEGDKPEEGSSPEHPIKLEGACLGLAALLRVLYTSHLSSDRPIPEGPLVIPAFRLANMFQFSELRAFLVPFAEKTLDEVDRILFAREFDIKEWLAPAHISLCQREKPLTGEEARKLGVENVLLLWRMREQPRSRTSPLNINIIALPASV